MDKDHKDAELIMKAGSVAKLAELLGFKICRVQSWKKRGIPARVLLDNEKFFKKLRNKITPL
jgi:hypothetical protein